MPNQRDAKTRLAARPAYPILKRMSWQRFQFFGSGEPGEAALLRQIRARAGSARHAGLRLGIGDDCALLRVGADEELAVTTDLSIAGRHFRVEWHPPESIGHRTLARGLSDLAAMGARPVAAFLSLGLPGNLVKEAKARERWVGRYLDGFLALARAYKTPLAGGDLAESPVAVADIVLTGAVRRGKALLRSGARAGDFLYVTGSLGGSAAGLTALARLAPAERRSRAKPGIRTADSGLHIPARLNDALAPHLYPQPRIAQGLWLARRSLASAAIDLSDGLSTDLAHICDESQVGAEVDAAALPLAPGATPEQALNGGEDYELLFTAPPPARIPPRIAGVAVTCIGRMLRARSATTQITLITAQGAQPLAPRGWQHFA